MTRDGEGVRASPRPGARGEEAWAVGAGLALLAVTAAWWAFALWPAAGETPAWLARARSVCFGVGPSGLPDAGGWLLLVGQPLGMAGVLVVVWGRALCRGLRRLAGALPGQVALGVTCALAVWGLGAAALRVASAAPPPPSAWAPARGPVEGIPRLDRPVPGPALVDQHGRRVGPEAYEGAITLVTFAFGHCESVCPAVVQGALRGRDAADAPRGTRLVVVTLDPWRDTPSRLPHLAEQWGLAPGDRVLGGEPEEVEAALDGWNIPRSRDPLTGDIVHPAVVYVVDREGRIAFASSGHPESVAGLARRAAENGGADDEAG